MIVMGWETRVWTWGMEFLLRFCISGRGILNVFRDRGQGVGDSTIPRSQDITTPHID
jgi:hypothetical protein